MKPYTFPYHMFFCMVLAGCASDAPIIHDVKLVDKAVSVSCIDQMPEAPKLHTDAELKAMGDYEVVFALLEDRIKREIYESKMEAILQGCK